MTTLNQLVSPELAPLYAYNWQKARDLITDKSNWCQGAVARDRTGDTCGTGSPNACQWDLSGAAAHAGANLTLLCGILPEDQSFGAYNDTHDHETVIGVIDSLLAGLHEIAGSQA